MKLFTVAFCLLVSLAPSAWANEAARIVKIGATLPLTGDLAHVGVDIRRGVTLALEELTTSPTKFEVIYEDNQHLPRNAITAAQKLLNVDRVDILVSLWDMADVVAPIAERKKVPHLSIRWNPHVAEKNEFTVTLESTYLSYAASQVDLLKELGVKTLGLITEESQGWTLSAGALKKFARKQGIQIVVDETFVAGTNNFSTITTKVLSKNPDFVVFNSHQPHLDLLLKRIREQRPTQRMTGYFEAVEPPSLVEGLPFVAQFTPAPWFADRFTKRYGEAFKVRAPHGYDLIKLIAHVFASDDVRSGSDFIDGIGAIKNFRGATGTLSINATRNIENTCVWQIAKDGQFVALTPTMLAQYRVQK